MYAIKNLNSTQFKYLQALCKEHGIRIDMPKFAHCSIGKKRTLTLEIKEHKPASSFGITVPTLFISLDDCAGMYHDWYQTRGGSAPSPLSIPSAKSANYHQISEPTIAKAVLEGMQALTK